MARGDSSLNVFQIQSPNDGGTITRGADNRGSAGRRGRGKNSENVHDINFKSIAKVGLAIRMTRMGNEALGSYTNNRLRERKVNRAINFGQYGLGIALTAKSGFGLAYAVGDLMYRSTMYNIGVDKKNIDARLTSQRAGNFTYNGNRFGGRKL